MNGVHIGPKKVLVYRRYTMGENKEIYGVNLWYGFVPRTNGTLYRIQNKLQSFHFAKPLTRQ